jgi:hypothetical protein
LHRNPRNSLEQFGQIDDASFFRLAGTGFADGLIAVVTVTGATEAWGELEFGFEL